LHNFLFYSAIQLTASRHWSRLFLMLWGLQFFYLGIVGKYSSKATWNQND